MKSYSKLGVVVLVALFWVMAGNANAAVRLPAIFGDHMVVQCDTSIPVWGWAAPGETVTVKLGRRDAVTTADTNGCWMVRLGKTKAGAHLNLTVTGSGNTREFTNILAGEVWIGSGQSNMEWPLRSTDNASNNIASANFPEIRLFKVPHRATATPMEDVMAKWIVCTPETAESFSAVAFFFGRELHTKLNTPVGLIQSAWGGTRIEPWTAPEGFFDGLPVITNEITHTSPMALYNGMIHPLVPFSIRGAIWYQGEANLMDMDAYLDKMKQLVGGWRAVWKEGEFPFYFVQLAPYDYGQDRPLALPQIWEAQTLAAKQIPNAGMAVINDIATTKNIHPRNKLDVGHRLAVIALMKTYGIRRIDWTGPTYASMTIVSNQIRLKFDHCDDGLVTRLNEHITWFAIAGSNRVFFPATAKIEKNGVVVSCDAVAIPVAVRFAWHQLAEPNLMGRNGLPVGSFRTDSWSESQMPDMEAMVPDSPEGFWYRLSGELQLDAIDIVPDKRSVEISRMLRNPTDVPATLRMEWVTTNTTWKLNPVTNQLILSPRSQTSWHCEGEFDQESPLPAPILQVGMVVGQRKERRNTIPVALRIRRQAEVHTVTKTPVVDGVMGIKEYPQTKPNVHFYQYRGAGNASQATSFVTGYDRQNLYVAVVIDEPAPAHVAANASVRDGDVYRDDSIEMFIDPNATGSDYYHFAVNLKGVAYDAFGSTRTARFGDARWNGDWKVSVKPSAGGFVGEFAIPFKTMGVAAPVEGAVWGMNICRTRVGSVGKPPEMTAWSPTYLGFHRPTHFGRIEFK